MAGTAHTGESIMISPFPEYREDTAILGKIALNLSANLLGLGNAATPAGLRAMERMAAGARDGRPTAGMCMFLLVNAFLVTGLFNSYSGAIFFLLGLLWFNGAVLLALCRWGSQWKGLRQATAQIVGGDPTVQIDTKHMYPDLAEHASQLNDLGSAINHAVEERLRSEHFKAELITNVSHDRSKKAKTTRSFSVCF